MEVPLAHQLRPETVAAMQTMGAAMAGAIVESSNHRETNRVYREEIRDTVSRIQPCDGVVPEEVRTFLDETPTRGDWPGYLPM
jgi:hypothetical protein